MMRRRTRSSLRCRRPCSFANTPWPFTLPKRESISLSPPNVFHRIILFRLPFVEPVHVRDVLRWVIAAAMAAHTTKTFDMTVPLFID